MIKKRNLDPSLIQWIMSETGLGPMIGDFQYVAPAASSTSQFRTQLETMGVKKIETSIGTAIGKTTDYRNDVVLIAPGTYVEAIADDLPCLHLLGCGATAEAVKITPAAGSAYAGELTNSVVSGITFRSASATNTTYAAFRAKHMRGSVVDGNIFEAGANVEDSCGFRIGLETDDDSTLYWMQRSRLTNNVFGTRYSGMNCWYGIAFGTCTTSSAYAKYQVMQDSVIGWNDIAAEINGILMNVRYTTGSNGIIRNNNVHGALLYSGQCHEHGIRAYDRGHDNKLLKVYWNNISAQSDCISGFVAQNVMGNVVGVGPGSGTPTDETMCN